MKYRFDTQAIHTAYNPDEHNRAIMPPIYQNSMFAMKEIGEQIPFRYARLSNPTRKVLEDTVAALEHGAAGFAFGSGMAAIDCIFRTFLRPGDTVVAVSDIYGGVHDLLTQVYAPWGVNVVFADLTQPENLDAALAAQPVKLVWLETPSNPLLRLVDIPLLAQKAKAAGALVGCDNTFATPVNCRPFEWGADIVVHSTTKYMDGQAAAVGGCIVDSGHFDWMAHADKFPGLCTPDESYHGLVYAEAFGAAGYLVKAVAQLMRDLGSCQSPQNAFLLNNGLETLHLRMRRHVENAHAVAAFLKAHPRVAWVHYADDPDGVDAALAKKYLPNGGCGVLAFGLKGTREEAVRFMDRLRLISIVTHVADAKSCILHPASHTHRQLSDEQLRAAGIAPDLMRLSLGIEATDDLIDDLRQALDEPTA